MKVYQKILTLVFFMITTVSFAQKSKAYTILGCWKFKRIEFFEQNDFNQELLLEAKNTLVCFDEKGKFTNRKSNAKDEIRGIYSLSADGKTLFQKGDFDEYDTNISAVINKLDPNYLVLEIEFGVMYFERMKD